MLARLTRGLPRLDALMALANQGLISGVTFAIGIGVARLLGVGAFGRLAMVLILQLFAQYLQGCFVVAPMMAMAGRRKRTVNYFAAVIAWSALLSIAAGICVAGAVGAIHAWRDGAVPVALAASAGAFTLTQNLLYTVRRMLFAEGLGWQALAMDTARYLAFIGAIAALWSSGQATDVPAVLWALAATGGLAVIPAALHLRRARLDRRLQRAVWDRHWPFARWLALMLLLTFGQEQAIALGLGATLSDEAIGGLRAGQYLIGTTHFIWVALENFVPGSASRAYAAGGHAALVGVLKRTTVVFGLIVWGVILAVSVPAEWSLRLAFGPGFEQYAPILRIYALTYAIAFSREVWVYFFHATQRTAIVFQAFAAGFLAAALVFYPAIKGHGILGAALTVLLANAVSTAYVMGHVWLAVRAGAGTRSTPARDGGKETAQSSPAATE